MTYKGQFKDGMKNGNGILTYFDGTKYNGEFIDDKMCGYGIKVDCDGKI